MINTESDIHLDLKKNTVSNKPSGGRGLGRYDDSSRAPFWRTKLQSSKDTRIVNMIVKTHGICWVRGISYMTRNNRKMNAFMKLHALFP